MKDSYYFGAIQKASCVGNRIIWGKSIIHNACLSSLDIYCAIATFHFRRIVAVLFWWRWENLFWKMNLIRYMFSAQEKAQLLSVTKLWGYQRVFLVLIPLMSVNDCRNRVHYSTANAFWPPLWCPFVQWGVVPLVWYRTVWGSLNPCEETSKVKTLPTSSFWMG